MNPILIRGLVALGVIAIGIGVYLLINRRILRRAQQNTLGLEAYKMGKPAILYFTMVGCVPCKTTQRPALARLMEQTAGKVQLIEVDCVEEPKMAEHWGVLSVPTTFIIDQHGRPRQVNHGVALTEKLLNQLEQATGLFLAADEQKSASVPVSVEGTD